MRTLPRPWPKPKLRPLPLKTRRSDRVTLVLDLDETLIHSEAEAISDADDRLEFVLGAEKLQIYVRHRPKVREFLRRANQLFEVVLFTASLKEYADCLLKSLDPGRRLLKHRYYRDSCSEINGVYVKDLSALGRGLKQVVIVDNSLPAFGYHLDNGILIQSWYEDKEDRALDQLWDFLEGELATAEDVRLVLRRVFSLSHLLLQ